MTTVSTLRRAGEPCERCGGQMFWTVPDIPMPWRDYRALVCLQCSAVGEEKWRKPAEEPVEFERSRRGRPPKRRPA